MNWWREGMSTWDFPVEARWNDVAPGTCLKPSPPLLPTLLNHRAAELRFFHLRHAQLGAGWPATTFSRHDIIECTGAPLVRVLGPAPAGAVDDAIAVYTPPWGTMEEGTFSNVVYAASWVDLRVRFPPDSKGSRYLQWQGVKSAVWGWGSWSAASDGVPFPKKRKGDEVYWECAEGDGGCEDAGEVGGAGCVYG
ncbi:MAG: hypothetical protein LQ344_005457 [Seirophora lacunosa]|nr:MAG: hypothetical protein LQ344_005457 [Seirophora lacunosa]